jgi:hypothetical protein
MHRAIAVFAALSFAAVACGQAGYNPNAKKLMPRDQLEVVEKLEELQHGYDGLLFRIKDAKQRGEENERLGSASRAIHESLVKKLQTEGVKDWIGKVDIVAGGSPGYFIIVDSWQPMHLDIKLHDKWTDTGVGPTLKTIKPNDYIRFSIKADSKCLLPKPLGKTFGAFGQPVPVDTMTAVEKIAVEAPPKAEHKTPGGKKKP